MIINKEMIKRNGSKIISIMRKMCRYSFDELQIFTRLNNTDLCLALMLLIQEGLIKQNRDEFGVYYALN